MKEDHTLTGKKNKRKIQANQKGDGTKEERDME